MLRRNLFLLLLYSYLCECICIGYNLINLKIKYEKIFNSFDLIVDTYLISTPHQFWLWWVNQLCVPINYMQDK